MQREITEFLGTCSSKEIGDLAEKSGRKFSYKKAIALIKEYDLALYEALALHLFNPWHHNTNIKQGNILHIVHSQIDYLFTIKQKTQC